LGIGEGHTIGVGVVAMAVAAAGVAVSLAGRHFGYPLLESLAGPGVTLLGALLWVGHRLFQGRRR